MSKFKRRAAGASAGCERMRTGIHLGHCCGEVPLSNDNGSGEVGR
jgi:hypothetical protein